MTMLRALALASMITLASSATALACSCRHSVSGPMSDIMANYEVRLVIPVEQRLIDTRGENRDEDVPPRNVVRTTSRVIDPLGLPGSPWLTSFADPELGGNCGWSPTLGELSATTVYVREGQPLRTGECTRTDAAYAAAFQSGDTTRIIPRRRDCDYSESWDYPRKTVTLDMTNPDCGYHDETADTPVRKAYRQRLEAARDAALSRPFLASDADYPKPSLEQAKARWAARDTTPPTRAETPPGGFIGKTILSRMTEDGGLRSYVLVIEDFDQFLPTIMIHDAPGRSYYGWDAPIVGVAGVFFAKEGRAKEDRIDLAASEAQHFYEIPYATVMGKALPQACRTDVEPERPASCEALEQDYRTALGKLIYTEFTQDELDAVAHLLPPAPNAQIDRVAK